MKRKIIKKKTQEEQAPKKVNPKAIAKERLSLLDRLTSELEKDGVPNIIPSEQGGILNIDNEYLILPRDITEVPSHDLGNYLNAFTQQKMYMRTLIGWQEATVEGAKRNYYDKFIPIYEELCKNKMSETAKELQANNHPTVKEVFLAYKDEKQKLSMLGYSLASVEDAIFNISREISRRGSDFNNENRMMNVR